jgi:hypothetical protein
VHHGRNPYCVDRNYGGTLIIWDRLFGTFSAERDNEPVVYGTLTPLNSWSPVWGNFKNFVAIFRDALAVSGWRNKLMVVFAPPGWTPENQPQKPEIALHAAAFETPSSLWQKIYGAVATASILCLVLDLLTTVNQLSMAMRLGYTLAIALSTAGIARVFEFKPHAVAGENMRSLILFAPLVCGWWFHAVTPSAQGLGAVGLLLSLASLAMYQRELTKKPPLLSGAGVQEAP